jgi:hypothetical protein
LTFAGIETGLPDLLSLLVRRSFARRLAPRMIRRSRRSSIVVGKVLENKSQTYGFDAQTEHYVDMLSAGIVDPAKVVQVALQDAASIAGLMITTEAKRPPRPRTTPIGARALEARHRSSRSRARGDDLELMRVQRYCGFAATLRDVAATSATTIRSATGSSVRLRLAEALSALLSRQCADIAGVSRRRRERFPYFFPLPGPDGVRQLTFSKNVYTAPMLVDGRSLH